MSRHGKFNARKVKDDNWTFDSKAEHKRYTELKLMLKAGLIEGLQIHPKFLAVVNDYKVCTIVLDFQYFDLGLNRLVYEDVKGVDTPISKLKRKLLKALYPDVDVRLLTAR